ncbi:hypothetical protein L0U85_04430 [Glycomyces sp. L485]|uniref:hypothetical protein n=1 Tax=Glycomyces sp. L485 TaxID=2909235 RepID=UPI001F4A2F1C|nr:hypothetical protein [Glycomyces sp. L485]MCH7230110.1 hypothetical protein [Glycomyces sp. L485]
MIRDDLLALTADSLAALANRGLVKRAAKELDAGTAPLLETDPDGTVRATFPDRTETALPAHGGMEAATCTCPAPSKCRHRVGAVLAYQREHEGTGETEVASPAAITDDQLREAYGRHAMAAAEKARRAGYTTRLTWPGPDRPAVAELPACTVSFLVPGLGYVHTDATGPARESGIVQAVWAFREAERAEGEAPQTISVGGRSRTDDLDAAVHLARRVLLGGVEGADAVLRAALAREAKALTVRRLHWPAGALADLIAQLERYHDRSAAYDQRRLAALLAEIPARERAGRSDSGTPNAAILGSDEAAETPLTLLRLTGMGCRVGTEGDRRTVELYFAQPETGMVLTVKRDWELPESGRLTGHDLAGRRLAGCRIGAMAGGNVVSEAASRTAARSLRLGNGRLAKTQVLPLGRSWDDLPAGLRVTDLDALTERLDALPPTLIRPRVAAELVRVIAVEKVESIGYDPAAQRVEAAITAPGGGRALVRAAYSAAAPGALEAVEDALGREPSALAGAVSRQRGGLVVEPTAILAADGPVVPDLAPGDDSAGFAAVTASAADPVASALETAVDACADLAHRGLSHAREPSRRAIESAAESLYRVGLRKSASVLAMLSKSLGEDDDNVKIQAWNDTAVRILVTAELQ